MRLGLRESDGQLDYQFKVLLIGDSGVGKTSLMNRFTEGRFSSETKSTIGVEYSKKTLSIDGSMIQASIWDTAGQERFRALAKTYYKGAVGALIIYDVTRPHTLENIHKVWMQEIKQHAMQNIKVVLIGNKADVALEERLVKQEDAKAIAEEYQMPFIETSAQSDTNVEAAFELLCREIKEELSTFPVETRPKNLTMRQVSASMSNQVEQKQFKIDVTSKGSSDAKKKTCC